MIRHRRALFCSALSLLAATLLACAKDETPKATSDRASTPWIVIGIDGGEWRVIEELWARGDLPHLRDLAERGTRSQLRTAYSSSPIIWTSITTGHRAETHGITGFTVSTPSGEVPVSSSLRAVPALWTMMTRASRRTAVLGWWASWPAESIDGVVMSDRALHADLDDRVSPASMLDDFEAIAAQATAAPNTFGGNPASNDRDQVVTAIAERLAGDLGRPGVHGFDLLLAYYRSVDIESHQSWKYFEPERFEVDPADLEAHRDLVPAAYRAVDAAIGRILAAAPDVNVIVLSDHGFHAKPRGEEIQILLDMNRALERLGWIPRDDDGLDLDAARVVSFGTAKTRRAKRLRYNLVGRDEPGLVEPEERDIVRARLTDDLARLTWSDGSPLFAVGDASARELDRGTDFEAFVLDRRTRADHALDETRVLLDGEPVDDLVEQVGRVSGTHGAETHGIVIAAGPDLEPGADLDGMTIFDVAPTLLYGLGLPVADDFAGAPRLDLFTDTFRASHPLRTVASWGTMERDNAPERSAVDEELVDELRALGYID